MRTLATVLVALATVPAGAAAATKPCPRSAVYSTAKLVIFQRALDWPPGGVVDVMCWRATGEHHALAVTLPGETTEFRARGSWAVFDRQQPADAYRPYYYMGSRNARTGRRGPAIAVSSSYAYGGVLTQIFGPPPMTLGDSKVLDVAISPSGRFAWQREGPAPADEGGAAAQAIYAPSSNGGSRRLALAAMPDVSQPPFTQLRFQTGCLLVWQADASWPGTPQANVCAN